MSARIGCLLLAGLGAFAPGLAVAACRFGALVGLGRLAATSELTVVRAAGRSLPQLALGTLRPALLLAVLQALSRKITFGRHQFLKIKFC